MNRIAIISAMAQELHGLHDSLQDACVVVRAGREFHLGRIKGREVVLVLSRIGKVAAATTAALLLAEFGAQALVFTGVAGGLGTQVRVGDVVIARDLVQHDMDASPIFPRYEVPMYGLQRFAADAMLSEALESGSAAALAHEGSLLQARLAAFGLQAPQLHRGLVLSGDRFVSSAGECAALRESFPDALAVEMEGAAVAQVCHDFGVPFAVMRTISDRADDSAHVDFSRFVADVASHYTVAVVHAFLARLATPSA